jgi:hypothetical protein
MPTTTIGWTLAFGIPGLKPLVVIAIVAFALYGRSSYRLLGMTRYGRMLRPFLDLATRGRDLGATVTARTSQPTTQPQPRTRNPLSLTTKRGPIFWALVLTATVALAGVIATRIAIHSSVGVPH